MCFRKGVLLVRLYQPPFGRFLLEKLDMESNSRSPSPRMTEKLKEYKKVLGISQDNITCLAYMPRACRPCNKRLENVKDDIESAVCKTVNEGAVKGIARLSGSDEDLLRTLATYLICGQRHVSNIRYGDVVFNT